MIKTADRLTFDICETYQEISVDTSEAGSRAKNSLVMPITSVTVPMMAAIGIPWTIPGMVPGIVPRIVPGVIKVRVIRPDVFVFFGPEIDFLGLNDRIHIDAIAQRSLASASNFASNSNCSVLAKNLWIEKLPGPYQKTPLGQVG
jgi:hypothetical protein